MELSLQAFFFRKLPIGVLLILLFSNHITAFCHVQNNPAETEDNMVQSGIQSPLSKVINSNNHPHPYATGLHLLIHGHDALNARIAMIKSATQSVDLQYYIADADHSGKLIFQAILHAANRGVKIRILVDDLNFQDPDLTFNMLHMNQNIQIKIFNPCSHRRKGILTGLARMLGKQNKFNRRMHNKTMIADNSAAIIGGRNLSDAYFNSGSDVNFRDIDLLVLGKIVPNISSNFEQFWNHHLAQPLDQLTKLTYGQEKINQIKNQLLSFSTKNFDLTNNILISRDPLDQQLKQKKLNIIWAKAKCWGDEIDKINKNSNKYISPPSQRLLELIQTAKQQITLTSAYFVPDQDAIKALRDAADRGVKISILTNSLAATDTPAVNSGHHQHRTHLLKHGIQIFELKPLSEKKLKTKLLGSKSRASLHAKAYVIDCRHLFLGSFNFDPRSKTLNTELMIEIESPTLSKKVNNFFKANASLEESYQVLLSDHNDRHQLKEKGLHTSRLIWLSHEHGNLVFYHYDPKANFIRNFISALFTILPLEGQL